MRTDDDLYDKNQSRNGRLALMVFSIGAIIGAVISLVLSRADQIKAFFRREQLHPEPSADGEQSTWETADPLLELPSNQASLAPGDPSITSTVLIPAAAQQVGLPDQKTSKYASPAAANPAVPIPGIALKTSQPVVKTAASVQAPAGKRWSTPTRYIMGVFLFLAILVVLFIGRSAIPMVVAAALLAVFVDPLIKFLVRRFRMKNGLAVGMTYLLVVVVLMLVPLLVIPSMVSAVNFVMDIDVRMVSERLSQFIQSLSTAVQANPALAAVFQPILDSLKMTVDNFLSTSQSGVTNLNLSVDEVTSRLGDVLGTLARFLGPTFSAIVSIFFTFLMSVQMTLTADGMRSWYADLIPPGYGPELAFMVTKIRKTWVGFLRGQMSLMLIIGVVTWLGASILGLRQALFLGIIAGVMELIPNIGPTIAAVPAVALALLFGSTHLAIDNFIFALIVVAFYVLVQLAENQLLVPNIMGDAVDLPPLVVLIGTIAGAGAFGIMGALLATPVIATGNLVFRYVYRKIIEDQPMAPPVEEKADFWGRVKGLASRFTHTLSRVKQPAAAQSKEMVPTTQKQK